MRPDDILVLRDALYGLAPFDAVIDAAKTIYGYRFIHWLLYMYAVHRAFR